MIADMSCTLVNRAQRIFSAISLANKYGFLSPLNSKLGLTQHWESFAVRTMQTKCPDVGAYLTAKGDCLYCLYQFPEESNTGNLSCMFLLL